MNPFKSLRYMIWEQYKFCLLKFLVVAMLIALMALFFYSMPVCFYLKRFKFLINVRCLKHTNYVR